MGTHWYSLDGEPVYTVKAKNGKDRDTTLADARKMNLVPSVTGIIDMAAKPALVRWMQNQVLEAVITYPPPRKIHGSFEYLGWEKDIEKWKSKIIEQSKRIGKDAAKLGSEIHDSLENYFKGEEINENHRVYLDSVDEVLKDLEMCGYYPEKSFSHSLGFGGKVDLVCNAPDIIIDYKTKDSDDFSKQLAYDGHCMQLAAYRQGLNMPKARCYNLFISTKKPGLVKLIEWEEEELQRGWEMFKSLLNYWKLVNRI